MLFLEKFCDGYRGQLEFYCERDLGKYTQKCFVFSGNKIFYYQHFRKNVTRQYCIGI